MQVSTVNRVLSEADEVGIWLGEAGQNSSMFRRCFKKVTARGKCCRRGEGLHVGQLYTACSHHSVSSSNVDAGNQSSESICGCCSYLHVLWGQAYCVGLGEQQWKRVQQRRRGAEAARRCQTVIHVVATLDVEAV